MCSRQLSHWTQSWQWCALGVLGRCIGACECGSVHVCVPQKANVSVCAYVCGRKEKTIPAIQPFLFNEEWKTGIQRCGYVPHINVCSPDLLPHFKNEWHRSEALYRSTTWEKQLMRERIISKPTNVARGILQNKLLSDKKKSWSQGYDVWVFSKRQPVSADCSINASYPGWRETLWDAQGALEIKYNVWVAQFEVHYKKAIWIANEATHICMLIRPVSSLVCRLLVMGRNVHVALLRDCFCINYQLCPTDHFPKQTWNARSKGDSKIKIIDWQSLDFRI